MTYRTPEELREALELIADDVALLKRVDSLLLSASMELDGVHRPIFDEISKARREIKRCAEGHHESAGVLRTLLRRAEREAG